LNPGGRDEHGVVGVVGHDAVEVACDQRFGVVGEDLLWGTGHVIRIAQLRRIGQKILQVSHARGS
jgi:hypothetical protein